ncbi:hypothetical protein [Paraburkholderia sediminicola]|uniref:hypothetical protein n=1 Tax=Paraburkholderia sediminicola TaxID=458836 RepID=UPI0038BA0CE2
MYQPVRTHKGGHLPEGFDASHDLCFVLHDLMAQLIKEGEEVGIFTTRFTVDEDERSALEQSSNVLDWLEQTNRTDDRANVLVGTVFPAVLSDMLHCIYEALETSRKGKLNVSYMLVRKPLQESLYLLESIVIDRSGFAEKLAEDPLKLRPKNAGGVVGHTKRIQAALDALDDGHRFDAEYLARLRYDKTDVDSFDGICNQAMHLFTEHAAIKTERLNVNFVFSGFDAKVSQWAFLYSRLSYVLLYSFSLVERIATLFVSYPPGYSEDISRRVIALLLLSWASTDTRYRSAPIERYVRDASDWLRVHCSANGFAEPEASMLERMAKTGAFPGESDAGYRAREASYEAVAAENKENPWSRI